jgi:hypothetical protein
MIFYKRNYATPIAIGVEEANEFLNDLTDRIFKSGDQKYFI